VLHVEITSKTLLADLARRIPAASDILRAHGIDPDVLADMPLGDAIEGTGLSIIELIAEIASAAHGNAGQEGRPAGIGNAFDELGRHLSRVLLEEGDQHPELYDTGRRFEHLRLLVQAHLESEDGATIEALARLKMDHPAIGAALRKLRRATLDYQPPAGTGPEWLALDRALSDLERDILRHIQPEGASLVPAARGRQA
jgi:iron-sulfur cluster repair protein YtfE (RIC family)